ncbi:MAG: 6,7-dimethyl-8-ribityllumazine synthase [Hyphomicrobiaceae bacterium]|nr:6,7-dimethyl-8-ribityllumazine synthase [Hyphomicrobiaceae bacterium]
MIKRDKRASETAPPGPTERRTSDRILIIEARFYEDIADLLAAGAVAEIEACGGEYERVSVPGALEIPQVLASAVDAGVIPHSGTAGRFSGAVVLGCVIRGETSHYDVVVDNANHWLMETAIRHGVPVGNGLLTVDTREQALERARGGRDGKGGDAARACFALIDIARRFQEMGT